MVAASFGVNSVLGGDLSGWDAAALRRRSSSRLARFVASLVNWEFLRRLPQQKTQLRPG